jgi:hypothetical protein
MCGRINPFIPGVNASILEELIYAKNRIIKMKKQLYTRYFIYNYCILKLFKR